MALSALDKFTSRFYLPPKLPLKTNKLDPIEEKWFPHALDDAEEYAPALLVGEYAEADDTTAQTGMPPTYNFDRAHHASRHG
jgi:hypothetical protein